jgi:hypothetical protein
MPFRNSTNPSGDTDLETLSDNDTPTSLLKIEGGEVVVKAEGMRTIEACRVAEVRRYP